MTQTLGIYGPGKAGKRAIGRFIPQHLGDVKGRFVFLADDNWGDSVDLVLDFAIETGDVLVIVPEGDEFIEDAKADGIPYQESKDPFNDFLDLLKAEKGDLILLYDDTSEPVAQSLDYIAKCCLDEGIEVFDLAHGMRAIDLVDTDAIAEEDAPEEEPEEEEVDPYEYFLDLIDACEDEEDLERVLNDKEHRDDLIKLAEAMQLKFNPSGWQSKIAERVAAVLVDIEKEVQADMPDVRGIISFLSAAVDEPVEDPEELVEAAVEGEPHFPEGGYDAEEVVAVESVEEKQASLAEKLKEAEAKVTAKGPRGRPKKKEPEPVATVHEQVETPAGTYEVDIHVERIDLMNEPKVKDTVPEAEMVLTDYTRETLIHELAKVAAAHDTTEASKFYTLLEEKGLV